MTQKKPLIFVSSIRASSLACQFSFYNLNTQNFVPKSKGIYLYNVSNFFFLTQATDNETVTNPMWQILLKEYFFSSGSQSVVIVFVSQYSFKKLGRDLLAFWSARQKNAALLVIPRDHHIQNRLSKAVSPLFSLFFPLTLLQHRWSP